MRRRRLWHPSLCLCLCMRLQPQLGQRQSRHRLSWRLPRLKKVSLAGSRACLARRQHLRPHRQPVMRSKQALTAKPALSSPMNARTETAPGGMVPVARAETARAAKAPQKALARAGAEVVAVGVDGGIAATAARALTVLARARNANVLMPKANPLHPKALLPPLGPMARPQCRMLPGSRGRIVVHATLTELIGASADQEVAAVQVIATAQKLVQARAVRKAVRKARKAATRLVAKAATSAAPIAMGAMKTMKTVLPQKAPTGWPTTPCRPARLTSSVHMNRQASPKTVRTLALKMARAGKSVGVTVMGATVVRAVIAQSGANGVTGVTGVTAPRVTTSRHWTVSQPRPQCRM